MKGLTIYIQQNYKFYMNKKFIKIRKKRFAFIIHLIIFSYFLTKFIFISYLLNCFIIILFSLQPPGHMVFYSVYKNQFGFYSLKQAENFLIFFNFIAIIFKILNEFHINHIRIVGIMN